MKHILITAVVVALCTPTFANAQEKGFREKWREADAKNCVSKKKFLVANAKQNRCIALSAEAANLRCDTDEGIAKVKELDKKCTAELKASLEGKPSMRDSLDKANASKKELDAKIAGTTSLSTPVAGAIPKGHCQAELADGTVLTTAQADGYTDCANQVKAKLKEEKCTAGTKKFAYFFRRADMKPGSRTLYCK